MNISQQMVIICAAAIAASAPTAAQQVPFSQHGVVIQRVSYTNIEITYNRPTARGRLLFGNDSPAVVRYGHIWHPGADSASRISFDKDVVFEGKPLKRGEYSIWLIPEATGPWTVILNSQSHVIHTPYPGEATDVLRVTVTPEKGEHIDALAYYFPVVARDSTVLRMQWGETIVPMHIHVSRQP
jgi:Protein of unknown function (DUF2911)